MDEIWQRHKVFILQCAIGMIVLLITWGVHSNLYDDIDTQQGSNLLRKSQLEKQLSDGLAPSLQSIGEQQKIAVAGQEQIVAMAEAVASTASTASNRVAYVRENVSWLLTNIGRPGRTDYFVGLYQQLPQTCLSELKEEARTVLTSRAAQLGRELDESLGIANSFADDQVAVGIHGLAIVVDVIKRGLDITVPIPTDDDDGVIEAFSDIAVAVRNRRSKMNSGTESDVSSFPVRMTLSGDPAAVLALFRQLNMRNNPVKRMTVVESLVGGERERADTDRVRVTLNLLGLHHLGVATTLEEAGK
jgi:hypothetical protein